LEIQNICRSIGLFGRYLFALFNYLPSPTCTGIVDTLASTDKENWDGAAGHGLASNVLQKNATTEEHIKACSFW
jgi:hypothetical protein